jgi:predicted tellurium resistance membrane protein TerC
MRSAFRNSIVGIESVMVEALIALVALSLMEIVLGIDNIVFISVATAKLPKEQQSAGRRLGLLLALGTRLLLLCGVFWIAQLVTPVFTLSGVLPLVDNLKVYYYEQTEDERIGHAFAIPGTEEESQDSTDDNAAESKGIFDARAWEEFNDVSVRDLILLAGGVFLIFSSVREIHYEVDDVGEGQSKLGAKPVSFAGVITQVAIMDIIFSLDSVITAVGMANQLWVMVLAVVLAVLVMILFANQVGDFVEGNPSVKMLALAFLLLIGVMLCAEGIGTPISKGYIYFAMGFSLLVEFFNMRRRTSRVEPNA